jgi:ubiquinone/menaquinone biosynthesis C-methylase UbiE
MRLLDLGGGTGATTAEFGRGARELVVLDPEDRKTSLGRASGAPVTFVSGVAEALPFGDGRFERVTSVLSCHHFSRPDDAFREAARVLLPGGRFVVYDLDPSHWSGRAVALVIGGHHHSIDRFASPEELVRRARSVGFRTARGERFGTGAFLIAER